MDWTRRHVLIYGGLGAAAAALWVPWGVQRVAEHAPAPQVGPLGLAQRRFVPGQATRVRVVGFDPAHPDPAAFAAAFTAAMDSQAARKLAQRIRDDVAAGRPARVLVKPAVNSGNPYPYTASARSVQALCAWLDGLGATEILEADMSGPGADTLASLQSTGLTRAAREGGAHQVLDLGQLPWSQRWQTHRVAQATSHPDGFVLSAILGRVDYVINVARAATHSLTDTTLSLKNWQGLAAWPTRRHTHRGPWLADAMAEYALAVKPDLVIIDAGLSVTTQGPNEGLAIPTGLLVVSEDMVAADLVGIATMRHAAIALDGRRRDDRPAWLDDPQASLWRAPIVQRAVALEVGVFAREQLLLEPQGVDQALLDGIRRGLDA